MSIHVRLTDEDYIRFNQFALTRTKRGKRLMLPLRLMLPIMLALALLANWLNGETQWTYYVGLLALALPLCILWVIFIPAYLSWSLRRRIPKQRKLGKLPYSPESDITWDDDSFTETTENATNRVFLRDIEHFYLTPAYIYLFVDVQRAYIIPRFASHPEIDAFIDFLKTKVPCEALN